jgi:hypothetical protein
LCAAVLLFPAALTSGGENSDHRTFLGSHSRPEQPKENGDHLGTILLRDAGIRKPIIGLFPAQHRPQKQS